MNRRQCVQIRSNGQRCNGYAVTGSDRCFAHDPAQATKRDDARRRGGSASRIPPLKESAVILRSMDDVLGLVELTVNDVRAGRVDVRIVNAIGVLANVAMKAITGAELEARLTALEAVLEPERARFVGARRRAA